MRSFRIGIPGGIPEELPGGSRATPHFPPASDKVTPQGSKGGPALVLQSPSTTGQLDLQKTHEIETHM